MVQLLIATLLGIFYPLTLFWALRNNSLWRVGLALNLLLLFFLGYVQFYIVLTATLLALLPYVTEQVKVHPYLQRAVKIGIVLLALLLGFHLLPGFEKIVFSRAYILSGHSAAFDIAYPTDKAIGVVLLLGYGVAFSVSRVPAIKSILVTALLVLIAVCAFAIPGGYLSLDIKLKEPMLIWAYGNLFITCAAEEVFFRGVIQYHFFNQLKHKTRYAMLMALTVSSAAFALAHSAGGINFMVMAFIAGLGYGAVYAKTRNLLDSILVHFLVNLSHIILFTYPYLSTAK